MFFKGSRYENVGTAVWTDDRNREVRYKRVRFIPETTPRYGYAVVDQDRLDNIAFDVFNDPGRFWRICDANQTMWPPTLVEEAGRVIGIPGGKG